MEMWYSLPPFERLQAIGALTADDTIRSFLAHIAAEEAATEAGMLILRAEAQRAKRISPKHIPVGAVVGISMCGYKRVADTEHRDAIAALPHDRLLVLRALGGSSFKVMGEALAEGLVDGEEDEHFTTDDTVRIGATRIAKRGKVVVENVCNFGESLGVQGEGEKVDILDAWDQQDDSLGLVVTRIEINDELVLPSLARQ